MEHELKLRIVLEDPPPGVDFGLQKGSGNNFEVVQKQRSGKKDLHFDFTVRVKEGKEGRPNFLGPFAQGSAQDRFVYLDIGTFAGQTDSPWTRRLKIPIYDIDWSTINKALASSLALEARVPGRGLDGGPNCASVKHFKGWTLPS